MTDKLTNKNLPVYLHALHPLVTLALVLLCLFGCVALGCLGRVVK